MLNVEVDGAAGRALGARGRRPRSRRYRLRSGRPAAAADGRVRAPERAGPRRHGHRLPRLAAVAGPAGGPQEPAPARRPQGRGPVPSRDPRAGPGRAPEPGQGLHLGLRGRPVVLRDGAGRWGDPGRRLRPVAEPGLGCLGRRPGDLARHAEHRLPGSARGGEAAERARRGRATARRRATSFRNGAFRRPRLRPARRRAGPPGGRGGPCAARGRASSTATSSPTTSW